MGATINRNTKRHCLLADVPRQCSTIPAIHSSWTRTVGWNVPRACVVFTKTCFTLIKCHLMLIECNVIHDFLKLFFKQRLQMCQRNSLFFLFLHCYFCSLFENNWWLSHVFVWPSGDSHGHISYIKYCFVTLHHSNHTGTSWLIQTFQLDCSQSPAAVFISISCTVQQTKDL